MGIIHAYFDESGKKTDHPAVSFCGVCINQNKIESFDDSWQALLRRYGWRALHMNEVMTRKKFSHSVNAHSPRERAEALKPFADCINNGLELGIVVGLDVKGFYALPKGMRAALGNPTDPSYVAFARALLELVAYCPPDDRIALICDHDNETAAQFFGHYKGIRNAHMLVRKMTVSLAFADDDYFPALQAADMVAYLARLEARRQFYREHYDYRQLLLYMVDHKPDNAPMQWKVAWADENLLRSMKTNDDTVREKEDRIRILKHDEGIILGNKNQCDADK